MASARSRSAQTPCLAAPAVELEVQAARSLIASADTTHWSTLSQSDRRAIAGFKFAARRAGSHTAPSMVSASTRVAMIPG
jgi:hypothetical protein